MSKTAPTKPDIVTPIETPTTPTKSPRSKPSSTKSNSDKYSSQLDKLSDDIQKEKVNQKQNILEAEKLKTQGTQVRKQIAQADLDTLNVKLKIANLKTQKEQYIFQGVQAEVNFTQRMAQMREEMLEERITEMKQRLFNSDDD